VFDSFTDCGVLNVEGVGEKVGAGAVGSTMEYVAKATLLCGIPADVASALIVVVVEMEIGAE
jgi:hypothetical protein